MLWKKQKGKSVIWAEVAAKNVLSGSQFLDIPLFLKGIRKQNREQSSSISAALDASKISSIYGEWEWVFLKNTYDWMKMSLDHSE